MSNHKKNPDLKPAILSQGNHTHTDVHAKQLHGDYAYQAITDPDNKDKNGIPEIPLEQVIEAKRFVEENEK